MKNLEKLPLPKEIEIDNHSYNLRVDYYNDKTSIGYRDRNGPAHGLTIQIKPGESTEEAIAILQEKIKNLC
jgi:hypothetical protein